LENLKKIVSTFLKVEPSEVNEETMIDRSSIKGSVLIHRMYSKLSSEGYHVSGRKELIRTFGDLIGALNGSKKNADVIVADFKPNIQHPSPALGLSGFLVGIDIEDVLNMPATDDYRGDKFYADNFSQQEISYCILQTDPRVSFSGKFAAKESIIKADNGYKDIPFSQIEILNDKEGKPFFGEFSLSISHTSNCSIAVAFKASGSLHMQLSAANGVSTDEILQLISAERDQLDGSVPLGRGWGYLSLMLSLAAFVGVTYLIISGL
jgi:phosphopantetheine--protein transferase-like protein